jgi:hypothetical protein
MYVKVHQTSSHKLVNYRYINCTSTHDICMKRMSVRWLYANAPLDARMSSADAKLDPGNDGLPMSAMSKSAAAGRVGSASSSGAAASTGSMGSFTAAASGRPMSRSVAAGSMGRPAAGATVGPLSSFVAAATGGPTSSCVAGATGGSMAGGKAMRVPGLLKLACVWARPRTRPAVQANASSHMGACARRMVMIAGCLAGSTFRGWQAEQDYCPLSCNVTPCKINCESSGGKGHTHTHTYTHTHTHTVVHCVCLCVCVCVCACVCARLDDYDKSTEVSAAAGGRTWVGRLQPVHTGGINRLRTLFLRYHLSHTSC